jgi:hypothetical protein
MTNLSWLSGAQLNCAFDSVRPFSANCDAAPAIPYVRFTST